MPATDPLGASPSAAVLSPWPWQPPGTGALLVRLTRQACQAEVGGRGCAAPGLGGTCLPGHRARSGAGPEDAAEPSGIRGPRGSWGLRLGWQGGVLVGIMCGGNSCDQLNQERMKLRGEIERRPLFLAAYTHQCGLPSLCFILWFIFWPRLEAFGILVL